MINATISMTIAATATASIQTAVLSAIGKEDPKARYAVRFIDLNWDGRREAIAYVQSPNLCGSGGCVAFVLMPTAAGYKRVMRTTVTRLPLCRLATRTKGWSDLGVSVGGGGIEYGVAGLRFDGRHYPSNPTTAPRVPGSRCLQVLIPLQAKLRRLGS